MSVSECVGNPATPVYRPRRPRSSPLYRLIEEHFERFCVVYEEEFERDYGPLRPVVRKAVEKYLECGIVENGFARVVCGTCKAEFLVGFSCKTRMLCPSCHAKRLTIWSECLGGEHAQLAALETARFHVHLGPVIDGNDREQLKKTARYGARALVLSVMEMFEEPVGIDDPIAVPLPRTFALHQNLPNPFNPHTTVSFEIPVSVGGEEGDIPTELNIFDIRGRLVRTLLDGELAPGTHRIVWDGRNESGAEAASGIYFYRVTAGTFTSTKKMMLVR